MCAEAHTINSGFGRYTKEILSRLYKNPNYEIAEFASYLKEDAPKDVPWKVYPNEPKSVSKEIDLYKSNPLNQFGQWRFDKAVLHFRPDIVFDIRDYWMFGYQELCPLRPYYHWVVAPTIDSIPQKPEWLKTYENADVVLTHTDWAANYLKSLDRPINVMGCVTDSVNPHDFRPISYSKKYHKTKYGIPADSVVIGSVMRNQKRKLIPELFRALRTLLDKTQQPNIFLYLHTSYPEAQGWNIPELLQEFGVYNNVLFSYYVPSNKTFFASPFKGPRIVVTVGNENVSAIMPNVIHGVDDKQLSDVYNCFDIYVQYAICEGLGIPQLEAASCGIPLFAVNYSGMEEITNKVNGIKINHRLWKELETGADRAAPDNDHLIEEIISWMNLSTQDKRNLSRNTRRLLVENYSWDKTAEVMMSVFDKLEPKNIWDKPMTYDQGLHVPPIKSNRDFVEFIINNVIKSPELLNTHYAQDIIRSLNESFEINNKMSDYSRKNAVQALEVFLNNKIFCEKIRSGELPLKDDFVLY